MENESWVSSPFVWVYRLALLVAMAGVLYLALSAQQPVSLGSDKANHVLAFAVLGALAQLGFPRVGTLGVLFPLFVFGVIIEALQYQVGRFAGMDDLVANLIGLVISAFVSLLIVRR